MCLPGVPMLKKHSLRFPMKTVTSLSPLVTSYYKGNISSIFSSNSVAFASELLENLEEMFPLYYMDGYVAQQV